jgi:hypothetical protein
MRTRVVNTAALALVLAGTALAPGQAPAPAAEKPKGAPAKSKLEETLAQALKDNPDIRVAAAKLAEAEAELNRVRLQVAQKVLAHHHALDQAQAELRDAEQMLARRQRLGGAVSAEELAAARTAVVLAKAKLAAVEAEAPYLVGKQPQLVGESKRADTAEAVAAYREALGLLYSSLAESRHLAWSGKFTDADVRGPMGEKIRKALDRPVTLRSTDAPPDDVVRMLRQSSPDLPIHFVKRVGDPPAKVTVELREVPLGAALEWLEDSLPGYRAVVREYGILITAQDRVPPGAASLHDFWKGKREDKPKPDPESLQKK